MPQQTCFPFHVAHPPEFSERLVDNTMQTIVFSTSSPLNNHLFAICTFLWHKISKLLPLNNVWTKLFKSNFEQSLHFWLAGTN